MKKRILSLVLAVLMLMGTVSVPVVYAKDDLLEVTNAKEYASSSSEKEDLTQYVNMRYGTGTVSQCIIGPARPNGSVHPGPDTFPTNNYTGYYPSKPIRGFSQMHIQAGEGRFGQFLISPQVGLSVALDSHDSDKTNENPTATEYSVTLSKYDIDVALTPTENAVIYKFTYPKGTDDASILLDMIHHVPVYNEANDRVYNKQAKDVDITIEQDDSGNTVLFGGAKYGAHGSSDRYYYFYAVIESASLENKTIGVYKQGEIVEGATSIDTEASTVVDPTFLGTGAYLNFDLDDEAETTVLMKIGVSFLSTDKAKASLENEIPAWNYDKVKSDNNAIWNDKLDVMEVSGLTEDQKEMFYTNLYDTFLQPRYRTGELAEYGDGMILDDHVATWDTFRTLFPLLTITNPQLITDMVESYVVRFEDKETGSADNAKAVKDIFTCFERISGNQGGDNIDNVIAEAYVKGLIPEEMMDAVYELVEFEATMMRTDRVKADQMSGSLTSTYKDLGYIPADVYPMMNCNTQLEYCYNDYCLAQIALGEGDTELYNMLMERSASWLNIWNENAEGDKFTGFIWPKNSDGSFVEPNSNLTSATQRIASWKPYFYEGTAYEYSFFVPHDIPTLIQKMGGETEFIERLQVGIDSGYIRIDNQPGYIQAFLFNYTSEPWHTSDYVEKLIKKYTINGTPGNDDSGASCAWYIFANIGFFPSAGQDIYWLTSPKYEETKINLDNGKTFTIKANNLSDTNKYIQAVYLNGEQLKDTMITHSDIVSGGTLVYEMGNTPVDYSSVTVVNGSVANGNYEWSLNSKGVLTISGTGDKTLRFDNVITAETISDIPWYSVREDIKKIIISEETGITSLCAYALSNLPSCEAIVIPTTVTNLSASRIFEKDTALAAIGTADDFAIGEFILENVTTFGSDIFADSSDGLTLLLSICKGEFAPVKWFTENTTVNFFINGNQPAVTWANNIKNGIEDTRADGYKFKIGSVEAIIGGEENDGNLYSWILDTTTGTLTFKNLKTDGSWNELSFSSTSKAFSEWIVDYKDEIKHIVIPKFNKFSCTAASPFANLKNLETVKMDTVRWSSGTSTNAIFANCTSLTTFGTSKNFEVGKVKLEGLECEFLASKYPQNIFKGCTAITSVDFTGMLRYSDAVSTQIELAIGANILSGCTSLREIKFGEAVIIDSNAFKGCTALTSVTVPNTVASIASNAFANCTALTEVTIEAEIYTDGLMTNTSFPDRAGLNIYCQNSDVKNAIDALGYVSAKVINVNSNIIEGEENVGNLYGWSFDRTTGTLTFKNLKTDGSWNELSFSSTATAFSEWIVDYKDEIKHIVIPKFDKFSCTAASPFANLKNLETVKMDTVRWSSGTSTNAIFANCTSLTTFGTSKNFEVGKVKLGGLECEFLASKYPQNIFKGCTAITSVDFTGMLRYSDAVSTQIELAIGANILSGCTSLREIKFGEAVIIDSNAFKDCTALTSVIIPETVTSIASNAFANCTALTKVTIEAENYTDALMTNTSFPDKEDLIIYCQNEEMVKEISSLGYTYTKAVNVNVKVNDGIKMEGFSIRTEEYNGLRGIFSFNNASIAANEMNGLTLVEYGGIVTTKANKEAYGTELTKTQDGFVTANASVLKAPVWSNGRFVGHYLSKTSDETMFAVTIVKYSNNFTTDICMIGYSIWQDAAGNLYYSYVDCENDEFDATSIYDVTLGMYKDGAVNASVDVDGVIWDTLVSGGAVTLTAGTDYKNSDIYYEANGTTAKSFGDTFLAVNVPSVSQSVSGSTFTCTNIGSTYSLFKDGDDYVIIFRAGETGSNPKALPYATGNEWNTMYKLQYSSSFAPNATKIVNAPNPVFTSNTAAKITYAIIDSGIEKIQRSTFYGNNQIKTIVYPDTLSKIERWAFNGSAITTMFKAGDIAEEGKLDLANYSGSIDMYALFRNAKNYKKVCLPATITNLGDISFAASNVTKIWISGNPEPKYDGIVDLTGANISTGDSSLQEVKNVNLVMLHDNATLHKTRTLDKMNSGGVTVWTKNHSEAIATEIQNIKNGVVYKMNVDYIVGDEALASYLATKYGS